MVLSESGKGLGRHGQALEPLNCVLDVSWKRLRGFRRRLEANLRRLGGFRKPFECAKGRPRPRFKSAQGCFWSFFWWFFEVTSKNCKLVNLKLGALVGTQRKRAEHVMFAKNF